MEISPSGRRKTGAVSVGGVQIGGGAPISIQSMTNTFTEDVEATLAQIRALAEAGCDIVRCAIPTEKAAEALREIKEGSPIPIVADIHFDYKLALAAIGAGADKVRINPGNIGGEEKLKAVADAAGQASIPLRIGVNGGSLEKDLQEKYGYSARALAESAARAVEMLHKMDFHAFVVSIKSSDIKMSLEAHRLLAERIDAPFHIGITEAGAGRAGLVKSAAGLGALLADGLGDTIRVSLTGNPVDEVYAAQDILRSLELLPGAIQLVSCPTCGRTKADLESVCREVARLIAPIERERIKKAKLGAEIAAKPLNIAVMGCVVNGPGEASNADAGVAFGDGKAALFAKGELVETVSKENAPAALTDAVRRLASEPS